MIEVKLKALIAAPPQESQVGNMREEGRKHRHHVQMKLIISGSLEIAIIKTENVCDEEKHDYLSWSPSALGPLSNSSKLPS